MRCYIMSSVLNTMMLLLIMNNETLRFIILNLTLLPRAGAGGAVSDKEGPRARRIILNLQKKYFSFTAFAA